MLFILRRRNRGKLLVIEAGMCANIKKRNTKRYYETGIG
jgi:hypothetical protein